MGVPPKPMEQPSSRSRWPEWVTLAFAAGAYACIGGVFAIKALGSAYWSSWGRGLRRMDLEMVPLVASPAFALLGMMSYVIIRRLGYHSWKNTLGLVLAAVWMLGMIVLATLAPGGGVEQPRRSKCRSNLRQLGLACHLYQQDNQGKFPPTLGALFYKYASDPRLFLCPSTAEHLRHIRLPKGRIGNRRLAYCYVAGLRTTDPAEYILAFDEEWNHEGDGMNVLCSDGRVRWSRDVEEVHGRLRKLLEQLRRNGREARVLRPSWSRYPDRPVYPPGAQYKSWLVCLVLVCAIVLAAGGALVFLRARKR